MVLGGRSYMFYETTKLVDIDINTIVSIDGLSDVDGIISLRSIYGDYNISVTGGYEGEKTLNINNTVRLSRSSGNYILTVNYNGQLKKYQVTSGNAYWLRVGSLICYRTSIEVQVYTETTKNT
jgi:hypothetical protein